MMQKPLTNMIGRYVTPATNEAFNALVGMGYRPERGRRARAKYDCINTDGVICDYLRDPSEYYKQAYYHNGHFYDEPYEEFTITEEKVPFPELEDIEWVMVEVPQWYPKEFIYTHCGEEVLASEISNEDFEFLKLMYENSKDFTVVWGLKEKINRKLHENRALAMAIGRLIVEKDTVVYSADDLSIVGVNAGKTFYFVRVHDGIIIVKKECTLPDDYIIPEQVLQWRKEYEKEIENGKI